MNPRATASQGPDAIRAEALFEAYRHQVHRRADRIFGYLMAVQWLAGIAVALVLSPYAWAGKATTIHVHVYAALILGGALSALPIALVWRSPGARLNRYVIAVAQALWSALLIHLTGGRIETHFHVFGSLAFLSFYREWTVLVPATVVVAADHFLRGLFWPESVYGLVAPESWRFLEHAFWVVFEDVVLVFACVQGQNELRTLAEHRASVERLSEVERVKGELATALLELRESQSARVRAERLAALGQLAASVGHELRNPLAAVRNAGAYLTKRLSGPQDVRGDPRILKFLGIIENEVGACTQIIGDLLDFARERKPMREPCPLRSLVADAMSIVPQGGARLVNDVPDDLEVPHIDKNQFRQVLQNLIQNGVEAARDGTDPEVVVSACGGHAEPLCIVVRDNGVGMEADVVARIFEPLYTTKVKGTGLGLAIVARIVASHGGEVRAASEPGRGTTFTIALPPTAAPFEEAALAVAE